MSDILTILHMVLQRRILSQIIRTNGARISPFGISPVRLGLQPLTPIVALPQSNGTGRCATSRGSAPRPVASPSHQGSNEARTLPIGG